MVESLDIPATITSIGDFAFFDGIKSDGTVICHAIAPPTAGSQIFHGFNGSIYVPDESVDAYKTKENWTSYANMIKPLSTYVE